MTIDEMIADAKLTDDTMFKVGEQEFKLGDLRKVAKSRQDEAAAKLAEIDKQRKEFDTERQRVQKLSQDALDFYEKLKAGKPANETKDDDFSFSDDPWLSRVGKGLTKLATQLADAQKAQDERAKKLEAALADGFKYVMTKEYERAWNAIPEGDRPKDKTWRDYLKVAQERNIVNEWGLPDPNMAYERETGADRLERARKAEYERGLEEGKKAAAVTQPPRPSPFGPVPTTAKPGAKDKVYSSVDELVGDAFGDADIQKIMSGQVS